MKYNCDIDFKEVDALSLASDMMETNQNFLLETDILLNSGIIYKDNAIYVLNDDDYDDTLSEKMKCLYNEINGDFMSYNYLFFYNNKDISLERKLGYNECLLVYCKSKDGKQVAILSKVCRNRDGDITRLIKVIL